MANLQGTIVDDKDAPIQGATVTLIGAAAPQVQVTNTQGEFSFPDLPPGTYRLSAISEGHDPTLRSDVVIAAGQSTVTTITMKAEAPATNLASAQLMRKPTVQSLALSGIGILFALLLYKGLGVSAIDLGNDEVARGVITYLVSVGTIMIAIVLVLSVILGNQEGMKDRFALGKEVLSVLIGVLGTIIGFYYGSTVTEVKAQPSDMQMATVKITPDQPQAGASFNLSTLVTGGEQPYTYSISFDKDAFGKEIIPAVVNQPSRDGKISQDISIPANIAAGTISFQIEVKDKKGAVFTYNKDGQQKLTLLARQPAQ